MLFQYQQHHTGSNRGAMTVTCRPLAYGGSGRYVVQISRYILRFEVLCAFFELNSYNKFGYFSQKIEEVYMGQIT
jgi:hypothetical protein